MNLFVAPTENPSVSMVAPALPRLLVSLKPIGISIRYALRSPTGKPVLEVVRSFQFDARTAKQTRSPPEEITGSVRVLL
jgi:hypothetical protein